MGALYFQPADVLLQVGRRLQWVFGFKELSKQVREGEYLIGYYHIGYVVCPWIKNTEIYQHFEDGLGTSEYYAITEVDFDRYVACP